MIFTLILSAVGCSDEESTPCEHSYTDGICSECGAADPDYKPEEGGEDEVCEHKYVDGICSECGDADITKIKATLNGADLGSYVIVYSEETDYAERAAEYIQSEIKARAGKTLAVCKAGEDSGEGLAILVGETERELSKSLDAECGDLQFAISSDGEDVALEGEFFVIAAAAYYFVAEYIPSGKDFSAEVPNEVRVLDPVQEKANNYFLLIGDGMGELQTKMFDYLDVSDAGAAISDGESKFYGYMLPYFGYSMTNSLSGTTDSAAAATAMATGYKTYNRYLGLDGEKNERKNLVELALELSMGAAVLTTDLLTGATPSGFTVHVEDRGSSEEIRNQQYELTSQSGVIIDGNYSSYTKNIVKLLENDVTDALDKLSKKDGFFMMYEEAHIDKSCSNLDIDKAFLSLIRFNQIIGRVMEYAFYNPDTMVIITADHETGDLTVDGEGNPVIQTEEHTGQNVPIFAYGVGAEAFDGVTIENTEIPKIIASLWGVSDFAK